MLELAVTLTVTASSLLLFGFWCWQAARLLVDREETTQEAPTPTQDLEFVG